MGRGHLSRLLPLLVVLAVAAPAAAASTLPFRVVAHGPSSRPIRPDPYAVLAAAPKSVSVTVYGAFGCKDHRVRVDRVTQAARLLTVHLTLKPLAPGTMECAAVYETYRVLVVPRSALHPTPTKAAVTLARA